MPEFREIECLRPEKQLDGDRQLPPNVLRGPLFSASTVVSLLLGTAKPELSEENKHVAH
jgi:hypothetical protein